MSVKNDYICGTCKYWNCDECYCQARGEYEIYEEDTCDNWTPEVELLTEEEAKAIKGDYDAHIKMVEGEII